MAQEDWVHLDLPAIAECDEQSSRRQCLRTGVPGRIAIRRRSLAEAEAWIADRKGQGPFAFETICETLEINPDWLRESLRGWRKQRLSGIDRQRQIRHLPVGRDR
jgi:hypothetical protein